MVVRQRAIHADDKQERHRAILNAAERLLLRSPDRIANMAEVAQEAGLAKGTVYLYFPSKEELLLALHKRNIDGFFRALITLLEREAPVAIEDVFALMRIHVVAPPLVLPLASRCLRVIGQNARAEAVQAFMQGMGERLERAGAGLERHFLVPTPGDGVALLRNTFALILGLWQMAGGASSASNPPGDQSASSIFAWHYQDELERAIFALWEGTLAGTTRRGAKR